MSEEKTKLEKVGEDPLCIGCMWREPPLKVPGQGSGICSTEVSRQDSEGCRGFYRRDKKMKEEAKHLSSPWQGPWRPPRTSCRVQPSILSLRTRECGSLIWHWLFQMTGDVFTLCYSSEPDITVPGSEFTALRGVCGGRHWFTLTHKIALLNIWTSRQLGFA